MIALTRGAVRRFRAVARRGSHRPATRRRPRPSRIAAGEGHVTLARTWAMWSSPCGCQPHSSAGSDR